MPGHLKRGVSIDNHVVEDAKEEESGFRDARGLNFDRDSYRRLLCPRLPPASALHHNLTAAGKWVPDGGNQR
ncbi:MAG: hypothetical protein JRN66_09200 [Nitrososphaerota archaeon]|nr:hypothetical protein [Nitrososphaerota archaeon]